MTTKHEIEGYIDRAYTYGNDTKCTLENGVIYEPPLPPDPAETATTTQKLLWQKFIEELVKCYAQNKQNLHAAYSLVWGQCTDLLRAKVKALNSYGEIK